MTHVGENPNQTGLFAVSVVFGEFTRLTDAETAKTEIEAHINKQFVVIEETKPQTIPKKNGWADYK